MKSLSNVEMALLEMIAIEELSGYDINRLVENRGYREWAGIGTTSIYVGLSKLEKKGLVDSHIDTEKIGKGPLPKKFSINKRGFSLLKKEVIEAMSTRNHGAGRFDLGLSALSILSDEEVISALEKRIAYTKIDMERVARKEETQGGNILPYHVRMLFEHSFVHMKTEIKFMEKMIEDLKRRS